MQRPAYKVHLVALSVLFTLVACQNLPFQMPQMDKGTATPEEAARLVSPCASSIGEDDNFAVQGKRPWKSGWIIIYTSSCPGNSSTGNPFEAVGYTFVDLRNLKWYAYSSSWAGSPEPLDPAHYVEIGSNSGGGSDATSNFSIVYGRVLTQEVATIEVTFEDRHTQRDQPKNGIFAVVTPGVLKACELRLFGPDGNLLHERDLQPFDQTCLN